MGEEGKELNPFQWASILLNLPGSEGYNSCKSWVSKLQADGWVACNLFTFVDDKWVTGADEDLAWQASHTLASKQSYLGIQDAGRKARPSSKTPGAWAGALVHVCVCECVLASGSRGSVVTRNINRNFLPQGKSSPYVLPSSTTPPVSLGSFQKGVPMGST